MKVFKPSKPKLDAPCCYLTTNITTMADIYDNNTFCANVRALIQGVKKDPHYVKKFEELSPETKLAAIEANPETIRYMGENVCTVHQIKAVQSNPELIHCIRYQPEEVCLAAVRKDGMVLRLIRKQTPLICLAAVHQNGLALQYVKNKTPLICYIAGIKAPDAWKFSPYCYGLLQNDWLPGEHSNEVPSAIAWNEGDFSSQGGVFTKEEMDIVTVLHNPNNLKDVAEQTSLVCKVALAIQPMAIEHVRDQSSNLCYFALSLDGHAIKGVREQTRELCMWALWNRGSSILHIREPTPELWLNAVKFDEHGNYLFTCVKPSFFPTEGITYSAFMTTAIKRCIYKFGNNLINLDVFPVSIIERIYTPDLCARLSRLDAELFPNFQSEENCLAAVRANPAVVTRFSPHQPLELYRKVLLANPETAKYIPAKILQDLVMPLPLEITVAFNTRKRSRDKVEEEGPSAKAARC